MSNDESRRPFAGPLRVSAANPRYFADANGRAVYLTGSHTWANLVDMRREGDAPFDYEGYLDLLEANHHNLVRLWAWHHPERAAWTDERFVMDPLPYARTGPGVAADGLPRFDLATYNPAYFQRLRERVVAAGERGVYVSVMLFQGWCDSHGEVGSPGDSWPYHPYHRQNNVNGLDGDPNGDGRTDIYSFAVPEAIAYQEAYVRQVVDTVNDLDNVLYEITNELAFDDGMAWQSHMVEFVREYERQKPKQHPVGITADGSGKARNHLLFESPADWISPWWGEGGVYRDDPPAADGSKVIISDTDHLWGIGGNHRWVWKSFVRGLQPIFMDPWVPLVGEPAAWAGFNTPDYPDWGLLRANMGHTRRFAERLDMNAMLPRNELASTRYCLAGPGGPEAGQAYLVYLPDDAQVFVNLSEAQGELGVIWFDPRTGASDVRSPVMGGRRWQKFASPIGMDVVLYLWERS